MLSVAFLTESHKCDSDLLVYMFALAVMHGVCKSASYSTVNMSKIFAMYKTFISLSTKGKTFIHFTFDI